MEAGATLLLLCALVSTTHGFYGDSISFMPIEKNADGTFKVNFLHRQNGRKACTDQSSYKCENGVCVSFDRGSVLTTDQSKTGTWCQSETHTAATVSTRKTTFTLREEGCCWESNLDGKTNWTAAAQLDLGTRSDSRYINSCPVTATVSSLRVPQNCFSPLHLLAHDPDNDQVKCRLSTDAEDHSNFTLDETTCTLTRTGQVAIGVHVFEVMLEDFPTKNITLTYADGTKAVWNANSPPLCSVKLQFSLEVLSPLPNCEVGHVQPMFLSKTPSQGDVLHATVGQELHIFVEAQAHHSSIHDFQVSGPQNMTKKFSDGTFGKADVQLVWTPQQSDIYRYVPVCFTAETTETQSEMRCVVIMVTQASILQGKAHVTCLTNKMVVTLEKASMPGIDENFLKLNDASCSLTSNNTHITGSMSFSTCGTKLEDKGDFIAFTNQIVSYVLPTEVIIRRKTVSISFSCQFPKSISISSDYHVKKSDYIFTESTFGSFGYTFEVFKDKNFTEVVKGSAYPVQVKLLEMIYMGIQAESELPNVKLFVESCKATPDDNPQNPLSYDIIANGCLKDETVKVHPSTPKTFNFEVQAFKFTGNYDQVYITCSVILCEPENPFSRCAQGCLKNPSRRRRRGVGMETTSHYVTQGPLQFVRDVVPKAAEDDGDDILLKKNDTHPAAAAKEEGNDVLMKKSDTHPAAVISPPISPDPESGYGGWKNLNTSFSTVAFASAFLVSVVLMAVVVAYFTKKKKADERKFLIVSD